MTQNPIETGQTLTTDVCIVGGGPAAIALALSLESSGQRITMITGGGWAETVASQDLNRGGVAPTSAHEPLEENRRRQFGGASAVWGGRCIPFEPIDFRQRSWVPESGWPIAYETLLPHYHKAAELCQIGPFAFDARTAFPQNGREIIAGLDSDEIVSYPLERWSPPVHFARTYQAELEQSPNIQVLLDAHVLALQMEDGSNRVTTSRVVMNGQALSIRASRFVLATGGIENARLLLASANAAFPTGLGNQHDNVGRYYMAHLDGTYAEVNPANRETLLVDFERDAEGVYCRRRWWLTEAAQETHQLLNTVFFLYHSTEQNGHRDALFSARYLAKSLLAIAGQKGVDKMIGKARELAPSMGEHAVTVAKKGLTQLPDMVRLGLKRFSKRRLPFVLPSKSNTYWGLYFQAEQEPNRESRVYLSATEKDDFGMPRAEVSIAFTEADVESVVAAHTLFVNNFRQKKLGDILYSEEGLRQYLRKQISTFNSAAHHIGTTRMSDRPETGVVDSNAKVFGIDNLYVAGSSVFPTGGHANPTLTLLAQSLLLAEHLNGLIRQDNQPAVSAVAPVGVVSNH